MSPNDTAHETSAETRAALLGVLKDVWGYGEFRPYQEEAMAAVLAARDSVVVLPTGGGKSICFQAPALMREGTALVVSPLISLMRDQVAQLRQNGVIAGCMHSGQPQDERAWVSSELRAGRLKLLYMSPERLALDDFGGGLRSTKVSFIAIDEAHCISMWGHDFRPEYRQISRLRETFPNADFHGYTATATPDVARDIAKQMDMRRPLMLRGSADRPNLHFAAKPRSNGYGQLVDVVKRHQGESGIVYCISRREVESVASALVADGYKAVPYHAGMEAEARHANQDSFVRDKAGIVVATIAFGMGINKPDVRFVVHMGMPKSIENYQQESGRAGRDGLAAECLLIYSGRDLVTWKKIGDDAPPELKRAANAQLEEMYSWCAGTKCRRKGLLAHFGEKYPHANCGKCDNCTGGNPPVADSSVVAQKILSCVKRVGESHNETYVTRVLIGGADKSISEAGHDKLSTFGLLKGQDRAVVKDWIGQLVGNGLLVAGDFGALSVTPLGWDVLRGIAQVTLVDRVASSAAPAPKGDAPLTPEEATAFERLRALRKDIATEGKIAPYMVFGDVALREMVRRRPRNLGEFARIKGVGRVKLDAYGEQFLASLWEGADPKQAPPMDGAAEPEPPAPPLIVAKPGMPSVQRNEAWKLFEKGTSIETVAEKIGRAVSTTESYLAEYILAKKIADHSHWVPEDVAKQIVEASDMSVDGRLKPIYDALEGKATYAQIRIVLACRANKTAEDASN